jgi:hypothetical protein
MDSHPCFAREASARSKDPIPIRSGTTASRPKEHLHSTSAKVARMLLMRRTWNKTWFRFTTGAVVVVAVAATTAVVALAGDGNDLPGPSSVGEHILDLQGHPDQVYACTLIGCTPGVRVLLKQLPGDARTLQLCSDGKCVTEPVDRSRHYDILAVYGHDLPETPMVSVRVWDSRGRLLAEMEHPVTLKRTQPNGPNCPPPCWVGWLRYDGLTNTLVPIPVPG